MNARQYIQLFSNMGWRYAFFRAGHELARRSGWLKRRFPVRPPHRSFIDFQKWKNNPPAFFFPDKTGLALARRPDEQLRQNAQEILSGRLSFFSAA